MDIYQFRILMIFSKQYSMKSLRWDPVGRQQRDKKPQDFSLARKLEFSSLYRSHMGVTIYNSSHDESLRKLLGNKNFQNLLLYIFHYNGFAAVLELMFLFYIATCLDTRRWTWKMPEPINPCWVAFKFWLSLKEKKSKGNATWWLLRLCIVL